MANQNDNYRTHGLLLSFFNDSEDYQKQGPQGSSLHPDLDMEGGTPTPPASATAKHVPHERDYNCCIGCLIKLFKKMYPSHLKIAHTMQGKKLREKAKLFTILNFLACMACLAVIGFIPMFYSAVVLAFSYSTYLTLREWVIVCYVCLCAITVIENFTAILAYENMF